MAKVSPIDGWGFFEGIDGRLAPRFEIAVSETGAVIGRGVRGWRGTVQTGKYVGATVEMTPRYVDWNGLVVVKISRDGELIFSGMAETAGLECNWK